MEVMSRQMRSSSLNPNAPMFVPAAYRAVDDFSDEWWSLVHSSPWFRDYWLQERFQDPQSMYFDTTVDVDFEDDDDDYLQPLFGSNITALKQGKEEEREFEGFGHAGIFEVAQQPSFGGASSVRREGPENREQESESEADSAAEVNQLTEFDREPAKKKMISPRNFLLILVLSLLFM